MGIIDIAHSTAIRAAIEASAVTMGFWPNLLNSHFDKSRALDAIAKQEGVGNFATAADLVSERTIIDVIQRAPELRSHGISAEESGEITGDGEWRWSIDPIDGTLNFMHGLPDFGICIALFEGDRVVVGVIAMPAIQQLIAVRDGEIAKLLAYDGAELARLAPAHIERLDESIVGYNLGYEDRDRQLARIANVAPKVGQLNSLGSFALGNFRVAQGQMGAYFGMAPTIMDIAPAVAILQSVGSVVTDMSGNDIDWNAKQRTYLGAVNPRIHEQLLECLR